MQIILKRRGCRSVSLGYPNMFYVFEKCDLRKLKKNSRPNFEDTKIFRTAPTKS